MALFFHWKVFYLKSSKQDSIYASTVDVLVMISWYDSHFLSNFPSAQYHSVTTVTLNRYLKYQCKESNTTQEKVTDQCLVRQQLDATIFTCPKKSLIFSRITQFVRSQLYPPRIGDSGCSSSFYIMKWNKLASSKMRKLKSWQAYKLTRSKAKNVQPDKFTSYRLTDDKRTGWQDDKMTRWQDDKLTS